MILIKLKKPKRLHFVKKKSISKCCILQESICETPKVMFRLLQKCYFLQINYNDVNWVGG